MMPSPVAERIRAISTGDRARPNIPRLTPTPTARANDTANAPAARRSSALAKTYVDFQPSEQQQETQANRRHHLQRSVHVQPAEYLWPQDDAEKNFEHDRRHGEPEHLTLSGASKATTETIATAVNETMWEPSLLCPRRNGRTGTYPNQWWPAAQYIVSATSCRRLVKVSPSSAVAYCTT